MIFRDRRDAGRRLARRLLKYKDQETIVLGVPRGGIVVADEVANALGAPLDVILARKIGAPQNEELAIGAVATDGSVLMDESLVSCLSVPPLYVQIEAGRQRKEIDRRLKEYRGARPLPDLRNRTVLVIDDGVATGMTMKAVLTALLPQKPRRVVLALPVAPVSAVTELKTYVDDLVVLDTPEPFNYVGQWYASFEQTTDEEVMSILRSHTVFAPRGK